MKRKILSFLIMLCFAFSGMFLLSACDNDASGNNEGGNQNGLNMYIDFFDVSVNNPHFKNNALYYTYGDEIAINKAEFVVPYYLNNEKVYASQSEITLDTSGIVYNEQSGLIDSGYYNIGIRIDKGNSYITSSIQLIVDPQVLDLSSLEDYLDPAFGEWSSYSYYIGDLVFNGTEQNVESIDNFAPFKALIDQGKLQYDSSDGSTNVNKATNACDENGYILNLQPTNNYCLARDEQTGSITMGNLNIKWKINPKPVEKPVFDEKFDKGSSFSLEFLHDGDSINPKKQQIEINLSQELIDILETESLTMEQLFKVENNTWYQDETKVYKATFNEQNHKILIECDDVDTYTFKVCFNPETPKALNYTFELIADTENGQQPYFSKDLYFTWLVTPMVIDLPTIADAENYDQETNSFRYKYNNGNKVLPNINFGTEGSKILQTVENSWEDYKNASESSKQINVGYKFEENAYRYVWNSESDIEITREKSLLFYIDKSEWVLPEYDKTKIVLERTYSYDMKLNSFLLYSPNQDTTNFTQDSLTYLASLGLTSGGNYMFSWADTETNQENVSVEVDGEGKITTREATVVYCKDTTNYLPNEIVVTYKINKCPVVINVSWKYHLTQEGNNFEIYDKNRVDGVENLAYINEKTAEDGNGSLECQIDNTSYKTYALGSDEPLIIVLNAGTYVTEAKVTCSDANYYLYLDGDDSKTEIAKITSPEWQILKKKISFEDAGYMWQGTFNSFYKEEEIEEVMTPVEKTVAYRYAEYSEIVDLIPVYTHYYSASAYPATIAANEAGNLYSIGYYATRVTLGFDTDNYELETGKTNVIDLYWRIYDNNIVLPSNFVWDAGEYAKKDQNGDPILDGGKFVYTFRGESVFPTITNLPFGVVAEYQTKKTDEYYYDSYNSTKVGTYDNRAVLGVSGGIDGCEGVKFAINNSNQVIVDGLGFKIEKRVLSADDYYLYYQVNGAYSGGYYYCDLPYEKDGYTFILNSNSYYLNQVEIEYVDGQDATNPGQYTLMANITVKNDAEDVEIEGSVLQVEKVYTIVQRVLNESDFWLEFKIVGHDDDEFDIRINNTIVWTGDEYEVRLNSKYLEDVNIEVLQTGTRQEIGETSFEARITLKDANNPNLQIENGEFNSSRTWFIEKVRFTEYDIKLKYREYQAGENTNEYEILTAGGIAYQQDVQYEVELCVDEKFENLVEIQYELGGEADARVQGDKGCYLIEYVLIIKDGADLEHYEVNSYLLDGTQRYYWNIIA